MSGLTEALARFVARKYLRKPDLEELILIKFPNLRSAFVAAINELCYILRLPVSFCLNSVNIEITNACNLTCRMCPVNQEMQRPKTMMSFDFFKKTIDDNPQLQFVLVFQWGEPLLHKDLPRMIRYCSDRGIRTMITSNAFLLDDKLSEDLIDSGLTRITFSVDGVAEIYEKIRGRPYEEFKQKVLRFREIRDKKKSPLKIDASMVVFDETEADVGRYLKEWKPIADRVQLVPRLSRGRRSRRCRELWRGALIVLSNGLVTVCCADYEGRLAVGDANTESLKRIFNGEKIRALRKAHIAGKFPAFCAGCDEYATEKVSKRFA
jgi:sulfatase maturation enzyme AslB (radical SAM superfamily)